jgi:uncharacterized protein (TIGR03083 family)
VALPFDRYRAEITAQTELLRAVVREADPATPVPTCPGWTVGALVRHLAGGQRWATTLVATRAAAALDDEFFRDVVREAEPDPAELDGQLAGSAAALTGALWEAGPDVPVFTGFAGGRTGFYARRFAYETAVHRADATLAAGLRYDLDPEVAVDALDEWMELGALPETDLFHPERRELLGPGRTVHLHATDVPGETHAEWVVDLTGERVAWRRAHEQCAVAVRGPLVDLLLVVYGRRAVDDAAVEVLGDRALLDRWLTGVAFR